MHACILNCTDIDNYLNGMYLYIKSIKMLVSFYKYTGTILISRNTKRKHSSDNYICLVHRYNELCRVGKCRYLIIISLTLY